MENFYGISYSSGCIRTVVCFVEIPVNLIQDAGGVAKENDSTSFQQTSSFQVNVG